MNNSPEFDERVLVMLRRVGKGKLLEPMASLFEKSAPARMSAMREAVRAGRAADAAMPAHSLKSSAGQLGAVGLQGMCGDIERAAEEGDDARVEALVSAAEPMLLRALAWIKSSVSEEGNQECPR